MLEQKWLVASLSFLVKKKLFWMTVCLRFNFPAFLTAIEESERGKQQFFVGLLEKRLKKED